MTKPHTTPDDVTVTPRDLHFDTKAVAKGAWLGGDVVGTAVFNALSLTFPDGERVFMDSVRHYRPQLSGKLLEDAKAFITQEAIHSREHVAMNGGLDRDHYPVAAIEAEIRQRTTMLRGRGPMAMLGATIALEHFTSMMADSFMRDDDLFENTDPEMKRLWQWHALEETEHKAVAFDVFQEVTKGWKPLQRYRLRVRIMVLISIMFTRNITNYATRLLEADGMKPRVARAKVLWFLFGTPGLFHRCANDYWAWYRPNFHPWDHDNRQRLAGMRDSFTPAMAAE